jgi:hypothetical protein
MQILGCTRALLLAHVRNHERPQSAAQNLAFVCKCAETAGTPQKVISVVVLDFLVEYDRFGLWNSFLPITTFMFGYLKAVVPVQDIVLAL